MLKIFDEDFVLVTKQYSKHYLKNLVFEERFYMVRILLGMWFMLKIFDEDFVLLTKQYITHYLKKVVFEVRF